MSILYGSFSSAGPIEMKTKIKYLPDASGKKELAPITAPVILQIDISGIIGQPKGGVDSQSVENILVESRMGLLKDGRVKAILLHVNTPGGTVTDADNIYRSIKEYKERYQIPVYAYIDGLCASGGMYVVCAADKVYASNASTIGSVGVIIGPFFNVVEALTKLGVKSETITAGLDKDMMSPFRSWKNNEDASLKALTNYFYNQFVDLVASSRPRMDKEKLISEYGAKIFNPEEALEYGYIDEQKATRNSTLLALMQEANIDPSKPYQVLSLESKGDWASCLFNEKTSSLFTGEIKHTIDTGAPQIKDKIAYLYLP
jgi:protease-4